jgi:hypothetical protein
MELVSLLQTHSPIIVETKWAALVDPLLEVCNTPFIYLHMQEYVVE